MLELPTDKEIQEQSLSEFRTPSVEIRIISEMLKSCELEQEIVIAPRERKEPGSILNEKFYKEQGRMQDFKKVSQNF